MKIVVTGASGFVGQNLVVLLDKPNVELLLVGRNPAALRALFPRITACGYKELQTHANNWDLLIHLAVANSDADLSSDEFKRINVDFLLNVADEAEKARIGWIINISSTHALDQSNQTYYALSKRLGANRLSKMTGINVSTVYLPLVYSDSWSGRLNLLNIIPKPIARYIFGLFAAFRPTVNVQKVADFILSPDLVSREGERIISDCQQDNKWYHVSKRLIDLSAALGVLSILWWAMLLIWLIVKLQSAGPGIFKQTRVGRNGQEFTCYKFRTMKLGTQQVGTHEITASSITSFGRLLRSTKLDELPQIINILRNEMSLIGPRPCLPSQTKLITARQNRGVLRAKPGISGLAQINGIDMSDPDKLAKADANYMALRCIPLDITILFATIRGKGQGDRVAT